MAISCATGDLATAAACFCGMSEGQQLAIQTYLLAVIAGGSTDPNVLATQAAAFRGSSSQTLLALQDYLLCQIVNK